VKAVKSNTWLWQAGIFNRKSLNLCILRQIACYLPDYAQLATVQKWGAKALQRTGETCRTVFVMTKYDHLNEWMSEWEFCTSDLYWNHRGGREPAIWNHPLLKGFVPAIDYTKLVWYNAHLNHHNTAET